MEANENKDVYKDRANLYSLARLEGESFDNYKMRRKILQQATKEKIKGKFVWQSMYQGTRINKTTEQ